MARCHLFIPVVDVRDVARAHLLAMTAPEAAGERFLIANGPALASSAIGPIIKAELGEEARRVPTRTMPDVVLRLASLFKPELRHLLPDLGYARKTENSKARRLLDWSARDPREAITSVARSMVSQGLIGR